MKTHHNQLSASDHSFPHFLSFSIDGKGGGKLLKALNSLEEKAEEKFALQTHVLPPFFLTFSSLLNAIGRLFMDGFSGKRAANGFIVSTERSRLVLRDTLNDKDLDAQFRDRLGCSGRLNFSRAKLTRSSLGSSSCSTKIVRSATRTCSAMSNAGKSISKPLRMLSSEVETASPETNSMQNEPEDSGSVPIPLSAKCKRGLQVNPRDIKSTDLKMMGVGSSSGASNVNPLRKFGKRCGGSNQDPPRVSSFSLRSKSFGEEMSVRSSRNKESGQYSSEQSLRQRKDVTEQRRSEGESRFSARGKKMSGSSSGRNSKAVFMADSRRAGSIPSKIAICDPSVSGTSSINSIPLHESSSAVYQMPQPDLCIDTNTSSSAHQYPSEPLMSCPISFAQASSSIGNLRSTRPSWPGEVAMTRPLISSDDFRGLHIDGIAQVLLALERLQQDEELTYEQVFLLENNLFLNGLNFRDQHRDMRLDIDNMSYEELLALEEKMGSVTIALSEEEMTKCLTRSMYHSTSEGRILSLREDSDDFKCCICQEEYANGDEIGSLQCKHKFHVICIQKWLRLKNWCPVCKSSATVADS